ncbi:MAG: flagellar basal body rod protein FlgB [Ignavibacteria bacterium]|jgi:flagellar basal-body rod protein FlgB|nr:flagellar basal body rod protein FlgB [Ignavibacteria bacterium]MCU7502580.1 flagellar basal body rod protein FlgB [Ignavibacteria bacterium]MCU7515217.1 flagellar basal body rod protein FlgB [Ignavibacteria bacterium]
MTEPVQKSLIRMMDFCTQKQKVLSRNIANIGTENYQREDVKFSDMLSGNASSLLKTTNPKHFPMHDSSEAENKFEITRDESKDLASGVNNVDIDTEMAEMAENTLKYKFASKKIGDYFKLMQEVIKNGSGH